MGNIENKQEGISTKNKRKKNKIRHHNIKLKFVKTTQF